MLLKNNKKKIHVIEEKDLNNIANCNNYLIIPLFLNRIIIAILLQ